MAATSTDLQQAPAVPRRRRSLLRAPISGIAGRIGITLVLFTIALVVIGPYVAPYSPFNIGATTPASGPTAAHWMGGDLVGRDVFSRFLDGGRSVILIPTVGVVIALVIGAVVGMWCGFRGGLSDSLIARLVDISFALPPLMVGLLLVTGFGTSSIVLVAVVVVLFAPRILRVIRGATHALVGQEFVLAAMLARADPCDHPERNRAQPQRPDPGGRRDPADVRHRPHRDLELPWPGRPASDRQLGADGQRESGHHRPGSAGLPGARRR